VTPTRIALPTDVELDVVTAGDPAAPALILLHGFPESHRTWRHQIPELAKRFFVIAPDQRGFARSSKPEGVEHYTTDRIVADLFALATHFGRDRFALAGHDWGGAVAWLAALQRPDRVERLIIANAPHPFLFQKSLFDDMEQRAASQYIRAFRDPGLETQLSAMGLATFFDTTFARHADPTLLAAERAVYLDQWEQPGALTAMLNWYRARGIVVPAMDETPDRPAFLNAPFPPVTLPTLVIWGTGDKALLPVQLEGLDRVVTDLTLVKLDAGHFVTWEAPDAVNRAMLDWLP
jgi:pimeloyl-ACP methyl ester carboxylesterase